jgi:hypothetical protein
VGLPGYWAILFMRAVPPNRAGCGVGSPMERPPRHRLRRVQKPRHPESINFAANSTRPTRSPAYASPVPLPSPSQGWLPAWVGSPFAGRDLHPRDD